MWFSDSGHLFTFRNTGPTNYYLARVMSMIFDSFTFLQKNDLKVL